MRTRALLIVAAVAAATTAGCGSGEPATSGQPTTSTTEAVSKPKVVDLTSVTFVDLSGQDAVDVDATDNTFTEQYIEVKAGTTITFTNKGRNQHNVVPAEDGAFATIETPDFGPTMSGTVTFAKPGDYVYYCSLHGTAAKGMLGAVRVLQ